MLTLILIPAVAMMLALGGVLAMRADEHRHRGENVLPAGARRG